MNPQAQKYTDPLTQPGYTKEFGYNTPQTGKIDSTSLAQTPGINFQKLPTPQLYDIYKLGSFTPMQATQQETQASELTKRLQGFNEQLAGQSQFRGEQEQQLGLPELTRTQKDLESRLTALKNESLAIPLQLQQQAQGRGVTAGGLKPIETGKLRENAIQALSVNSQLEASRGNLTLAQDMVDRAVAQKYDPIKEQIAINTANLDLILKDPTTSLQDKNRAEQQKLINEQRTSAIAKQENDSKEILKIGTAVASAGAPATVIDQIQKAQSPMEALSLASPYLGLEQQISNRLQEERIKTEQAQRSKIISDISATGTGAGANIQDKLSFVKETITEAKKYAGAAGRSSLRRGVEARLVGSTDYTKLASYADTLRTNVLSLATDPNIRKFFGPQMSNADIQLMLSAGSTLDPERQDSKQVESELKRLEDLFNKLMPATDGSNDLRSKYNY